ncbi:MAG: sensor histidine kinase [[Clostridium] scindens]
MRQLPGDSDPGNDYRKKKEYIHIEIQDNGVGIEPVKIANLLNEEQDGYQGGIGLRNVSRRLKLHYGIPLDIQTSPGSGHHNPDSHTAEFKISGG